MHITCSANVSSSRTGARVCTRNDCVGACATTVTNGASSCATTDGRCGVIHNGSAVVT